MKKIITVIITSLSIISAIFLLNIKSNTESREDKFVSESAYSVVTSEKTLNFGFGENSKIKKTVSNITSGTENYTTFFLKENGVLYYSGNLTNYGGLARNSIPIRVPDSTDFTNGTVSDIAAGDNHTLILANGVVYSMGTNSHGQLGDNSTTTKTSLIKIPNVNGGFENNGIVKIAAGFNASFILDGNGVLFSFGNSLNGRLGNGKTDEIRQLVPKPIENNTSEGFENNGVIVDVSSKLTHTLFLTTSNTLYSFGLNSRHGGGALGVGDNLQYSIPKKVKNSVDDEFENGSTDPNKQIISISAGWAHSLVLLTNGNAYGFGSGADGRLGIGDVTSYSIPTKVSLNNIVHIHAGAYGSGFVTSDGKGYGAGLNLSNNTGWITTSNTNDTPPVQVNFSLNSETKIKEVLEFGGSGHQFVFIVTEEGKLYATGLNTNGQLAVGNTANVTSYQQTAKLGAQFTLTGSSIKHEDTKNYTMKYKSDVTVENVLLEGTGSDNPSILIDGIDKTGDYEKANNSLTLIVNNDEEKEFTIKVRYNASSIIEYKIIIDKKAPDVFESILPKAEGTFDSACVAIERTAYCNKNIVISLPTAGTEELSGYMQIIKRNLTTNVESDIEYSNLTDGNLYEQFTDENSKMYEYDSIEYTIIDGAGNVETFVVVLDNMLPRLTQK